MARPQSLRELCDSLGVTYSYVAAEAGMSRATLHKVDAGTTELRKPTMLAIAYVLEVDWQVVDAAVQESRRRAEAGEQ